MDPETLWSDRRHQRGRPPAHTREAVVARAVEVADAEGLSAVTMRRVAFALGSGTMSLYTYVSERDALLELMIDAVAGEQELPPATGDWRADVAAFARAQRALMRRHPWLPVALAGRRTMGPNTLKALDHALALLAPTGMPPRARLEAFTLVSGFVAGHVGHEVAQEQGLGDADQVKPFAEANARYLEQAMESGAYPHLAAAMASTGAGAGADTDTGTGTGTGTDTSPATATATEPATAPTTPTDPDATFDRLLARVINALT